MKNEKPPGSLFGLLAGFFLLFTVTLFLITGSVFLLWNTRVNHIIQPADWFSLLQDSNLTDGHYDHLKKYIYGDSCAFAILDENAKTVYSSSPSYVPVMTQEKLQAVEDFYTSEVSADVYKCSFTNSENRMMTILLKDPVLSAEEYYRAYRASLWLWLIFLPLYILDTGFFIFLLNRKIRIPLEQLNKAVLLQAEGNSVRVGNCGGTREIRRIGESFDTLTERLEESEKERRLMDESRQKLIADISHDLKTPITVIAGYADAVCDGKVPPEEVKRYLAVIREKAESLTKLINAFHEYSKIEHPDFVLQMEKQDLCEYSREYLVKKYDEIDLAGFSLQVSIPEEPIYCQIDGFQLQRVLDNLLSNSLRYNRLGTILFFDIEKGDGKAYIRIADNGRGIPKERTKSIFEPFVVGNEARSSGGSGLGLSIAKRIMELHGGDIILAEKPRTGRTSEFILTFSTWGRF